MILWRSSSVSIFWSSSIWTVRKRVEHREQTWSLTSIPLLRFGARCCIEPWFQHRGQGMPFTCHG